jgi:plasmid stabilization system protein ParE
MTAVPIRIFGREFGAAPGPPSHPALVALRAELAGKRDWYRVRHASQLEAGKAILAATPAEQVTIVVAAVERAAALHRHSLSHFAEVTALGKVISELLRRDLPLSEAELITLLDSAREFAHSYGVLPTAAFVHTAERFVRQGGPSDPLRKALDGLRRAFGPAPSRQEDRRLRARLDALLGEGPKAVELRPGEAWADAVLASLAAMAEPERNAWRRLLAHAQSGDSAKPAQKWLKAAEPLVNAVGTERLRDQAVEWLERVTPPKDAAPPPRSMEELVRAAREATETLLRDVDERTRAAWTTLMQAVTQAPNRQENLSAAFQALLASPGGMSLLPRASDLFRGLTGGGPLLPERHADALRGLVWICSLAPGSERLASAVGDLAERCLKKIPGYGAFSPKVGHACLWTLGAMSGIEPVAQLGRLKQRVKYPVSLRLVDKALAEAARRASLSPEDLEEIAVPTYGLTGPGLGHVVLADYTAASGPCSGPSTKDGSSAWTERPSRSPTGPRCGSGTRSGFRPRRCWPGAPGCGSTSYGSRSSRRIARSTS